MTTTKRIALCLTFLVSFALPSLSQTTPPAATNASGDNGLAQQAADPTAPLMAFNMKEEYYPSFYGVHGTGNDFIFQPVIPFNAWGQANLLRATVNYNISGPGGSTLNNVSVFDLLVFNEKWGRWGFGPLVQFAPSHGLGSDTALAGPAIGFVARKGKWNLGLFNQNLFGSNTRFSSLQPIVAYVVGKGWSLASGDAQWSVNWSKPQVISMPIGIQVAKVQKIGKQPVRFLVNPEYNARNFTGAPHWTIRFGFTILAPGKG